MNPFPKEVPRNTVEFMRLGYNDACINFLIDFNRFDFDELVRSVLIAVKDGYNEFDAKKFVAAFKTIQDRLYKAKFGREGSPAFYAVLNHDATNEDVNAVKAPSKIQDLMKWMKLKTMAGVALFDFGGTKKKSIRQKAVA